MPLHVGQVFQPPPYSQPPPPITANVRVTLTQSLMHALTMLTCTVPLKPSADCRLLPNSLCPAHDPRYAAQEDKQKKIAILKKRSLESLFTLEGPSLILPVPNLLEEVLHVNFLGSHFDHPRVLEHTPWGGSTRAVFLKTKYC
jgi:hypothetical protein